MDKKQRPSNKVMPKSGKDAKGENPKSFQAATPTVTNPAAPRSVQRISTAAPQGPSAPSYGIPTRPPSVGLPPSTSAWNTPGAKSSDRSSTSIGMDMSNPAAHTAQWVNENAFAAERIPSPSSQTSDTIDSRTLDWDSASARAAGTDSPNMALAPLPPFFQVAGHARLSSAGDASQTTNQNFRRSGLGQSSASRGEPQRNTTHIVEVKGPVMSRSAVGPVVDGYVQVPEGQLYYKVNPSTRPEAFVRPVITLIHAGIAHLEMWNAQVDRLVELGWTCLRFDVLGYGRSFPPSEQYLQAKPRPPYNPVEHLELVRQKALPVGSQMIIVGCSIGAEIALGYTLACPQRVVGLVLVSGGVSGFDFSNDPAEDALFERADELVNYGDNKGAANIIVRIRGDGPLQDAGRLPDPLVDILLPWNAELCRREYAKTGGFALEPKEAEPPVADRLHQIGIPVAVAYGVYDATYTKAAMRGVADALQNATIREFEAAHLINMECEEEFDWWLSDWLQKYRGTDRH